MNKMKSGIYMWTSPSGKKYIGQSIDLVKRYNQFLNFNHRYGGKKINDARTKYHTIDEWSYKVLERCGIDDLDERERYYIALYDTMNNGYNCESGGNENKTLSDETKLNLKMSMTGDKNPNFGTHRTDKTKQKISEALKGKTFTDEHKRNLSIGQKGRESPKYWKGKYGKDHHSSKAVLQYTIEGILINEFGGTMEAERITGINHRNISSCCRGLYGYKTAGGFKWAYKKESD